jgi:hypothetical protein
VVGVVLFALALLLREAFLAVVTAPITSFLASIQVGLTGEWIFRFIMAIVAVALILVAIGLDNVEKAAKTLYGWYRSVRYPRKAQELEAQERLHRQDALKEWRDTLAKWVVDRDNPLTEAEFFDPRRKAARRQTLEVLKQQDPEGKKSVLLILYDWSLIRRYPFPIIDLSHADFSNAHLESVDLQGTNLSRVNLKDADLSGARLGQSPENISKMEQAARAIRMIAGDLTNSAYTCDLQGAKLSGAILKDAVLVGCVLVDADFEESDLAVIESELQLIKICV